MYAAGEEILRRQVYAIITSENLASIRFHERMGYPFLAEFSGCGCKFDRWLGVTWMAKTLIFVENVSNPPVPWLSIVDNDRKLNDILADLSLSQFAKM